MMAIPVAIFKSTLLPNSETFIRSQGESMTRYEAFYFGLQNADGLLLPRDRSVLLCEQRPLGGLQVAAFKATGLAPSLTRKLRSTGAKIIHAHFGTEAWRAMQLRRPVDLPVVVTFHGADATTDDSTLRNTSASARQLVRHRPKIFAGATRCIAVSHYIGQRLIAQGCPPEKMVVHQIGVDSGWFRPRVETTRTLGVLFVGRLVEKKGLIDLLKAITLMNGRGHGSSELTIVGDGPERANLEAAANRMRITAHFVGMQSHPSVRDLMHKANVLVVPSLTALSGESEGLPTVIREAQASGLPVIATRTAGAPEAITHGTDGLLVPPRDAALLADELERLMTDQVLQDALRAGGLRTAASVDISKQTASLEDIYDDVLAGHKL